MRQCSEEKEEGRSPRLTSRLQDGNADDMQHFKNRYFAVSDEFCHVLFSTCSNSTQKH